MVFKNGKVITTLMNIVNGIKYSIYISCDVNQYKEILILSFNYIKNISNKEYYVIIREYMDKIYNLSLLDSECEITISANSKDLDIAVPIIL